VALSPGVRPALAEGFRRAARESGLAGGAYLRRVLGGDGPSVARLIEHAVIGETYFFRHPEQLAALGRQLIAPRPLGRPLRVWSAGCASGEEPYTVAMMLLEARRATAPDRILATDVSLRALDAARAGLYGEWSLRRVDPARRARFFKASGRRVAISPEVRSRVEFRRHNLVADPAPGGDFDLVLCRNVLIYFGAATARGVLSRLVAALRPGGWLLVGPVEAPLVTGLAVDRLEVAGAVLLRKPDDSPAPAAGPQAAAAEAPLATPRPWRLVAPPIEPVEDDLAPRRAAPVEPTGPAVWEPQLQAALAAARAGDTAEAERRAREAAGLLCPEAFLLLAAIAEVRGDPAAAVEAVRRAVYLESGLAQAHAMLVTLHLRLGRPDEAARARRNALEALRGLPDAAPLRGLEPITAGALRQALGAGAGRTDPASKPQGDSG
jgi:chemotaxis protein methyltransferase CheR